MDVVEDDVAGEELPDAIPGARAVRPLLFPDGLRGVDARLPLPAEATIMAAVGVSLARRPR